MTASANKLIVGVGSPHGDDQAGWLTAEFLMRDCPENESGSPPASRVLTRRAAVPADILHWVEDVDSLHIIDARQDSPPVGRLTRLRWPDSQITETGIRQTHGLGVPDVLRLADTLGHLPTEVIIWAISGSSFLANSPPGKNLAAAIPEIANRIWREICNA